MGKRIDDLPLDDTPIVFSSHTRVEPDERTTDWYRFSQQIDDLLATGRYTWAEGTLTAIQETVLRQRQVSEAQRRAVINIETAGDERRRYGRSRRYEGHYR